jgi:hypothetical protein
MGSRTNFISQEIKLLKNSEEHLQLIAGKCAGIIGGDEHRRWRVAATNGRRLCATLSRQFLHCASEKFTAGLGIFFPLSFSLHGNIVFFMKYFALLDLCPRMLWNVWMTLNVVGQSGLLVATY